MLFNAYEYWQNAAGEWNFRLRARNYKIQYSNKQGYTSERDCLRGIKDARRNSRFAVTKKVSPP